MLVRQPAPQSCVAGDGAQRRPGRPDNSGESGVDHHERRCRTVPRGVAGDGRGYAMIYLDYQATTPLAPEAREAMLPWLSGPEAMGFANPHSPHRPGRTAAAAIDLAREQVATLLPTGGQVRMIEVGSDGLVPQDTAIPAGTDLVAVMQVNNEIGTIQPVAELARAA